MTARAALVALEAHLHAVTSSRVCAVILHTLLSRQAALAELIQCCSTAV